MTADRNEEKAGKSTNKTVFTDKSWEENGAHSTAIS
jgi:hypothetical protein